jgi:caffeoyl-CoA O-methyltransferase
MPGLVDEAIEAYVERHTDPPPRFLAELAAETRAELTSPQMLSGPVEGRLLETLVFATGARRVLELGTYSGYSALWMAGALPPDGRVITCELDADHAKFARAHIAASPYADRIDLRVGPALETLERLDGPFDLIFIDADKPSYGAYYDASLPKLAERGLMVVDNTLFSGRVLDPAAAGESAEAIAAFNDRVVADERVTCVMLSVRDGVTLIRRRA